MPTTKNLLMISIDDLKDLTALKGLYADGVATPHLDALMARGTQFTQAFSQSPLCSPSRSSALTGLYPASQHEIDISEIPWYETIDLATTMPAYLKSQGFQTVTAGKIFHQIDNPPEIDDALWDAAYGTAGGTGKPQLSALYGSARPQNGGQPYTAAQPLSDEAATTWASQYLATVGDAQPFFLALGLNATHDRWDAPGAYFSKYSLDKIILPEAPADDLGDVPPYVLEEIGMGLFNSARNEFNDKRAIQAYLASVSFLDDQIGRLMQALDSSGHADDTAIVLWSDHGYQHGEKNYWNKFTLWDAAARAPMAIIDPNVGSAGSVAQQPVGFIDIFPTVTELLGLDAPAWLEGRSLKPLLENPNAAFDHPVFTSVYGSYSIRTSAWRYTLYEDGSEELYDIINDPREYVNLASSPATASIKTSLQAQLLVFLDEQGVVRGTAGNDDLVGDAGNNEFFPGAGADRMAGGAGDDVYQVTSLDDTIIELPGDGEDTAYVLRTDYVLPDNVENIKARAWRKVVALNLTGNSENNQIEGARAADKIYGLAGADTIRADAGNDLIDGGAGNDILYGSGGFDILIGGTGSDEYYGGAGADMHVFTLGNGRDTVYGFTDGIDKLSFVGLGTAFNTPAEIIAAAVQIGTSTVIALPGLGGGTPTVTLVDFAKSDLDASDFVAGPGPSPDYDLRVRSNANGTVDRDLYGTVLARNAYISLKGDPTVVADVKLSLDGQALPVDEFAPYEITGNSIALAEPIDTRYLADGIHAIVATVQFTSGQTIRVADLFLVNNAVTRINAGGGMLVDSRELIWRPDRDYVDVAPLSVYATTEAIAGTEDGAVYQTERWSPDPFGYEVAVANGDYLVTLHFAELYFEAAGKRLFDVALEGELWLDDLDIFAEVGKNTALIKQVAVTVEDGLLDIDFINGISSAQINGIEITPIPPPADLLIG